nr:chromo domain containing protein [Trichoderma calamagrostidis]
MESIMAAILTPGKGTVRTSPRTSLGTGSSVGAQGSPRIKKKTPASTRRRSFARRLIDQESTPQKQDEEESEVHNADERLGDSVQLGGDAVASRSRPRAPQALMVSTASSKKEIDTAGASGGEAKVTDAGNSLAITDRGDVRAPETGEEQFSFKRFVRYRWVGDSIEIQVEWESGETTWEPETNLHQDASETLFEYWREQGGRPNNPRDPEIYEVFAILKHNKNRSRLLVEWVGYERTEASWASRKTIEETAKDIVDAYFDSLKTSKAKK